MRCSDTTLILCYLWLAVSCWSEMPIGASGSDKMRHGLNARATGDDATMMRSLAVTTVGRRRHNERKLPVYVIINFATPVNDAVKSNTAVTIRMYQHIPNGRQASLLPDIENRDWSNFTSLRVWNSIKSALSSSLHN
jgi:hypothetical protein